MAYNKTDKKLNGFYIKNYKNGLKLTTTDVEVENKSIKVGTEWLYWNTHTQCWFSSKKLLDQLIYMGAKWYSKCSSGDTDMTSLKPELKMMQLFKHGKGYILVPPKCHSKYGHKYFYSGWWMKTKTQKEGWFFKKESLNDLMVNGVVLNDTQITQKEYTLVKYGKGLHMKHTSGEQVPSHNYWMGGWWQEKHKAWFFKMNKEHELTEWLSTDSFCDSISELSDDYKEFEVTPLSGMILTKYKNGLLLKVDTNHESYGVKYFNDGFWIPSLEGWVFKPDSLSNLVEKGVNYNSVHCK